MIFYLGLFRFDKDWRQKIQYSSSFIQLPIDITRKVMYIALNICYDNIVRQKSPYKKSLPDRKLVRKCLYLNNEKNIYMNISAAAESKGETVNGYIKKAIDERMERDNRASQE